MTATSAVRRRPGVSVAGWLGSLAWPGKAAVIAVELAIAILLWQWLVTGAGVINAVFVPAPSSIADALGDIIRDGTLADNAAVSLRSWLTGFILAVIIGLPVGLLMGGSLPVNRIAGPIAWTVYATPSVAYQPLAKAWFGFGTGPVVFLVTISAVFPLLLNTAAGMQTTNRSHVSAARVYGASRFDLYRKVFLPSTIPFVFTGLRQAATLATIGMTVAELSGSSSGMGALIIRSSNMYRTDASYAAIVVIIAWSVATTLLIIAVERLTTPWTRVRR